MTWTRKPRILLCGDSPFLDTGFGRVIREIGTGLVLSGQYEVSALGFWHKATDRLVPFHVHGVWSRKEGECFGERVYDQVVQAVRPDLVITVGEEWTMRHIAARPRPRPRKFGSGGSGGSGASGGGPSGGGGGGHKLVGYFPIDGTPVSPRWKTTFEAYDHLVAYGPFGREALAALNMRVPLSTIAHGVDLETFRPLGEAERAACKRMITDQRFVIGCVARNTVRKNLSRLVKAFNLFTMAWAACTEAACGWVGHAREAAPAQCPQCGSAVSRGPAKNDAYLYLHCLPHEPRYGIDLPVMIDHFGLGGRVGIPTRGLAEGEGCADEILARLYNGMDVFCLPTGGEGWGLPILEAMGCRVPVLVTGYSGCVDFVAGAGEFINVSDFQTQRHNTAEHAIPDLQDMVMKLDRYYYEREEFLAKWGPSFRASGVSEEVLRETFSYGSALRGELGRAGHERAQLFSWASARRDWLALAAQLLDCHEARAGAAPHLTLEAA